MVQLKLVSVQGFWAFSPLFLFLVSLCRAVIWVSQESYTKI